MLACILKSFFFCSCNSMVIYMLSFNSRIQIVFQRYFFLWPVIQNQFLDKFFPLFQTIYRYNLNNNNDDDNNNIERSRHFHKLVTLACVAMGINSERVNSFSRHWITLMGNPTFAGPHISQDSGKHQSKNTCAPNGIHTHGLNIHGFSKSLYLEPT